MLYKVTPDATACGGFAESKIPNNNRKKSLYLFDAFRVEAELSSYMN